jgi:hypothetical protein
VKHLESEQQGGQIKPTLPQVSYLRNSCNKLRVAKLRVNWSQYSGARVKPSLRPPAVFSSGLTREQYCVGNNNL